MLRVQPVRSHRDSVRFVALPHAVHSGDPNWVAPLNRDVRALIDRRRNPFFDHGEAEFWIALDRDRPIGRISAQVNRLHLDTHQDATGHFGLLEAVDDPEVFAALFGAAEAWLRERGMVRTVGPFSLSINDEIGVLVSGFERPPMLMTAHSPQFYGARIEGAGYRKVKDVHGCLVDVRAAVARGAERIERVTARLREEGRIAVRRADPARYAEELRLGLDIYNDAWSDNWGFVPTTAREARHFASVASPVLRPEGIVFAEIDGKPVAMAMVIQNVNELIADLHGRLLPLGWLRLLWRLRYRRPRTARFLLAGVRRAYRDSVLGGALVALLGSKLIEAAAEAGVEQVEMSWILEDNVRSLALAKVLGGPVYKTWRLYQKALA